MNTRSLILIMGCAVLWSGCTSVDKTSPLESKTLVSQPFSASERIMDGRVRVVFIRDSESLKGPAVNIFLGGHYLTSLLPGGYKALQVCANPTRIAAAYTQSELNYLNVRQQDSVQQLTQGTTHYFRLVEGSTQPIQLQALSDTQAQEILTGLKEQVNTLSRVTAVQDCLKPAIVHVPVKSELKKYTLQANTLFRYAKSGPNDLTAKGKQEIAAIAAEISRDQASMSHIAVMGYTDPVGSESSNQQLSQRRAETVRSLLVQNGVAKTNILVEGRGEQALVVSDCEQRYPKDKAAREECDTSNRRVEIITYGMKAES